MKSKLEYIWLDGYMPTQSLRSKTQVIDNFGGTLEECPMWSFDGAQRSRPMAAVPTAQASRDLSRPRQIELFSRHDRGFKC